MEVEGCWIGFSGAGVAESPDAFRPILAVVVVPPGFLRTVDGFDGGADLVAVVAGFVTLAVRGAPAPLVAAVELRGSFLIAPTVFFDAVELHILDILGLGTSRVVIGPPNSGLNEDGLRAGGQLADVPNRVFAAFEVDLQDAAR